MISQKKFQPDFSSNFLPKNFAKNWLKNFGDLNEISANFIIWAMWSCNSCKIIPYMDIRFLAITQSFFGQSGWFFLGTRETIYLSISDEESWFWRFFWKNIDFWRQNRRGRHAGDKGSRASTPDQKVGLSDGTFGSTLKGVNLNMSSLIVKSDSFSTSFLYMILY